MYNNLDELIAKQNMNKKEIYRYVGIINPSEAESLTFSQAIKLHKKFFCKYSFEYVFKKRN